MRKFFLDFHWKMIAAFVAGFMFFAANCHTQPQDKSNAAQKSSVKTFLQRYVGVPSDEMIKQTRYSAVFVDLIGDGSQEVVVYLTGPSWCGTGGCTMLILAPEGESYKVVNTTTVTRLPIRVLKTKSNGWYDITLLSGYFPKHSRNLLHTSMMPSIASGTI